MIWAILARTPDILQFIGLLTLSTLVALGVWFIAGLFNRFKNYRRK